MLNDFENKITILIIVPAYLPGYRAGGPIRSIASMVELLGDEFDFKIITYDRDLGMMEPYAGIVRDTWRNVGKAEVYYASKMSLRFLELRRLINSVKHDILYLNSFFSPTFTIKPLLLRYLKLIPDVGTIVAPRGEFSQGALKLKWWKKQLYILVSKALGLYRNLLWQASSGFEKKDIECAYSRAKISIALPIMVAPDLESANMIFKQLTYLAGAEGAGIVLGTRVPVVLTSRADTVRTRLTSTAVMTLIAHARRTGKYETR